MVKIIPPFIAILVISLSVFALIQIYAKAYKKTSTTYYEIIIINLILILQLADLYKLFIKDETSENTRITEIIYRKPAF